MLRLFARSAPTVRNSFITRSSYTFARTMATGKANNEDLKGSKLFDVSHVTAIVTGGGSTACQILITMDKRLRCEQVLALAS